MNDILRLRKELEKAVLRNDIEKADKISDQLFRIQGGMESDTVMPAQFVDEIIERSKQNQGSKIYEYEEIYKYSCHCGCYCSPWYYCSGCPLVRIRIWFSKTVATKLR